MSETLDQAAARQSAHPIHPQFLRRWSPRAFSGEAIPDEVLFSALEAARWAPSGSNLQPWRFLYSKKGSSSWERFLGLLKPGNRRWAENASALIVFVSRRTRIHEGQVLPNLSNAFDAGAAWLSFSLQALELGWHTHGIGGFDHDLARRDLKIPNDFEIHAVIAIGKQADKSLLPPELQERETPNKRLDLRELALEGGF